MLVLPERHHVLPRLTGLAGWEAVPALPGAPPEARASPGEADLLPDVLPDIGDDHPSLRIERGAPGVAHAVGPDLRPHPVLSHERVVGGHVGRRSVDVEPQDRAEQGRQVLGVAVHVVLQPTIPQGHVEHPVRPEEDLPAVVVGVGLSHLQQHCVGARRRGAQIGSGGHPPLLHHRPGLALSAGHVVQEEAAVGHELGMQRDAQQALLRRREHGDAQQLAPGPGQKIDPDRRAGALQHHEQSLGAGNEHQLRRLLQAPDPLLQVHLHCDLLGISSIEGGSLDGRRIDCVVIAEIDDSGPADRLQEEEQEDADGEEDQTEDRGGSHW